MGAKVHRCTSLSKLVGTTSSLYGDPISGGPAIAQPPNSPATLKDLNRPTPVALPAVAATPAGSNRPAVGQPNSPAMANPHRMLPYCDARQLLETLPSSHAER